jgi:hypothetical protein
MAFELRSGSSVRATVPCVLAALLLIHVLTGNVSAITSLLPCNELQAHELWSHATPSSDCLSGLNRDNVTVLYDWLANGESSDEDVYDIHLPFPFRFFDVLYNGSVYINSNSFVTFGGSFLMFYKFGAFSPPFPSILIGAEDMKLKLLTVGWSSSNWVVHYEGILYEDDDSENARKVWELTFLENGGLKLCTGVFDETDSSQPVSAISHQRSSEFAKALVVEPNFMYTFATTCAAIDRVVISAPIASITGVQLRVNLFVTLNASDISTWTITLRGAGFSCPANSSASFVTSPPQVLAFGTASVHASDSPSPVLVVSGIVGNINGSVMLAIAVFGASTPFQPQDAFSDLAFAAQDRAGNILVRGGSVHLASVKTRILLDKTPLLELSQPVIRQRDAFLKISVTSKRESEIFHQYSAKTIVITLSGLGWSFDPDNVIVKDLHEWASTDAKFTASFSTLENSLTYIRIDFDPAEAGVISDLNNLQLLISPMHTPHFIQGSLVNVKCAILNDYDSVLAEGSTGFLGDIYASTMGSFAPSVHFSTPLPNAAFSLSVKFIPNFHFFSSSLPVVSVENGIVAIIITMSGRGISCPFGSQVAFLLPNGAMGKAEIDSSDPIFPVLKVTASSGFFLSGAPIWFQVESVSAPSETQPELSNIRSAVVQSEVCEDEQCPSIIVASSVSGTMNAIVTGMGHSQPSIRHAISEAVGKLFVSFVPSVDLPANSMIRITVSGAALVCSHSTPVAFTSPILNSLGATWCGHESSMSVLSVSVPGEISARSNISFVISPVFATFSSNLFLNGVRASAADVNGKILMASDGGTFSADASAALTVKDYIISASSGVIILPDAPFIGNANCDNVINETMPLRAAGLSVVLKGSGSGTVIDCRGTAKRCLIVHRSSIIISSMTFKGGSSEAYIPTSILNSILDYYNALKGHSPVKQPYTFGKAQATAMQSVMFQNDNLQKSKSKSKFGSSPTVHPLSSYINIDKRFHPTTRRRSMLQSTAVKSTEMFSPDTQGCGGCVIVDAAGHSVSLNDVSFVGCNGLYGGGGFFNVSSFSATGGLVSSNVARQGGGLFVSSTHAGSMKSVSFVRNIVATSLPSEFAVERSFSTFDTVIDNLRKASGHSIGEFSRLPDPSAAAGGGVWFQMLNAAENCSFIDNTAIAVSPSYLSQKQMSPDGSWQIDGAHALGSGMFVVQTRALQTAGEILPAVLADLVFRGSRQLCALFCVSGGALFIGELDGGTQMTRFVFKNVTTSAVSSRVTTRDHGPSVALGSCIVVADMHSAPASSIRDIHIEFINSRAAGKLYGGCISFVRKFSNASIFNVSVFNANLVAVGEFSVIYGLVAAHAMFNSRISGINVQNISLICDDDTVRGDLNSRDDASIIGGVIYSYTAAQMNFSGIDTNGIRLQSSSRIYGGIVALITSSDVTVTETFTKHGSFTISNRAVSKNCQTEIFGGVFLFYNTSNALVLRTVTSNVEILSTDEQCRKLNIFGGILYVHRHRTGGLVFADSSTTNFVLLFKSAYCSSADGLPSCQLNGGLLFFQFARNISIYQLTSTDISCSCSGHGCLIQGCLLYTNFVDVIKLLGLTLQKSKMICRGPGCRVVGGLFFIHSILSEGQACSKYHKWSIFDVISANLNGTCFGDDCSVLGGVGYVEKILCMSIGNIIALNSAISSFGENSQAAGSILGVGASNSSFIFGIRSSNSSVRSDGVSSQALGGALAVLSGNVSIHDCSFFQSIVHCSGYRCAALGGILSAVSTLVSSSDLKCQISLLFVRFSLGNVSCTGIGCVASGGAVAVAVSYRASVWIGQDFPFLSDTRPPSFPIDIQSCVFVNNSVSAFSTNASAGGGAISLRSSVANMVNCSFFGSGVSVVSGSGAIAGGGALHVLEPGSKLIAQDCSFSFNDASSSGQGGAIFASAGAVLVVSNMMFHENRAGKGGAIAIDASEIRISNSEILRNVAVTSGGGMFCSSNQEYGFETRSGSDSSSSSAITLHHVSIKQNNVADPLALGVGADLFVIGSVVFSADSATEVSMQGNFERDVTAAVISVMSNSPSIELKTACLNGSMLRIAPTSLKNFLAQSDPPSASSMNVSKCFPACLEVPKFFMYVASSGFLASCTPCPRGTYNLGVSTSVRDSVSSFCFSCPFGADCLGGDMVTAQDSYWGWKLSDSSLTREFLLLSEGYGCKPGQCDGIDSCGGNRNSVLCGGCIPGYSAAFFTTDCVADRECSAGKLWLLIFMALLYAVLYTIFLRYSPKTLTVENPNLASAPSFSSLAQEPSAEIRREGRLSSSFQVLMWYYQLVGLLLAMPNPLKFFDGQAVIFNIIGLIFGTAPASQVFELPSLVFCTKAGSTTADILLANLLFYILWTVVLALLSVKRVWLPVYRVVYAIFHMAPEFWDNYENACETLAYWGFFGKGFAFFLAIKWYLAGVSLASLAVSARHKFERGVSSLKTTCMSLILFFSGKKGKSSSRIASFSGPLADQNSAVFPSEVRGQAWLNFGVIAYSAVLSLMIQCTTCVEMKGYQDQGVELPQLRWFYDGRVVCFSDSGEQPGGWQIAALFAVVALVAMPGCLAVYMSRSARKPETSRNIFDKSAFPTYFDTFNSSNRHWFTVM